MYNQAPITYYKCVRDYIGTRVDDLGEIEAIEILGTFYPLPMIRQVIAEFGNPEQIFNSYGQLQCWNCETCHLKSSCLYSSVEKIYKEIKERYASNPIDQKQITKRLDL
jgi:ribosomal protein S12 methylthiotransferase accessory factor